MKFLLSALSLFALTLALPAADCGCKGKCGGVGCSCAPSVATALKAATSPQKAVAVAAPEGVSLTFDGATWSYSYKGQTRSIRGTAADEGFARQRAEALKLDVDGTPAASAPTTSQSSCPGGVCPSPTSVFRRR